jgi:hypothetical protein
LEAFPWDLGLKASPLFLIIFSRQDEVATSVVECRRSFDFGSQLELFSQLKSMTFYMMFSGVFGDVNFKNDTAIGVASLPAEL